MWLAGHVQGTKGCLNNMRRNNSEIDDGDKTESVCSLGESYNSRRKTQLQFPATNETKKYYHGDKGIYYEIAVKKKNRN